MSRLLSQPVSGDEVLSASWLLGFAVGESVRRPSDQSIDESISRVIGKFLSQSFSSRIG